MAPQITLWKIIGAGAKGFVSGLIEQFLGGTIGGIAGLSIGDIGSLALGYYLAKRGSGNWRDFGEGLFIKAAGDVIEHFIGVRIPSGSSQSSQTPRLQHELVAGYEIL